MVIGACVNGIGDETRHPPPPDRNYDKRNYSGKGWGLNCEYTIMKQNSTLWNNRMFPLYDGADFRRRCGTRIRRRPREVSEGGSNKSSINGRHTAFHFHNWFANVHSIRHKYGTYGHAHQDASEMRVKDLNADTAVMYQCALGRPEWLPNQKYGYQQSSELIDGDDDDDQEGSIPIFFQDVDYRKKRHDYLKYMIDWDETEGPGSKLTKEWDHSRTKNFNRIKVALHGKHVVKI
jgi:hypothetical protein